ncbi:MAG: hypothetical protein GYB35_16060 [Algicola sp.]|nr:hypothetical protein [Algicola sp.]
MIGVQGQFIEATDLINYNPSSEFEFKEGGVFLGSNFGNEYLDKIEILVFKGLIKNTPKSKLANELNITTIKLKSIIKSIQKKLQCSSEREIIIKAVREGLPIKLFT